MDANERESSNQLFEKVVGAVYEVSNTLGAGFLEKVYERALKTELNSQGIKAESQVPIQVLYRGKIIGDYFADLLVEDKMIVELKCVETLNNEHVAQTLNYLKATDHHLALLVNFQHLKVEWRRIVQNF